MSFPPDVIAAHARARSFEILAARELDAILQPRDFVLVRQTLAWVDPTEGSPRPASAIYEYEAGPAEYVRRYPALREYIDLEHIGCIDLWLHLDIDGFIRCELEGYALGDLLARRGHDDELARYKAAPPAEVAQLEAIGRGLRVVLDAATER